MMPIQCPRCQRSWEEWSIERKEGRAGCPCGEVIDVSFDDEEPLPPALAPPTRPRSWREQAGPEGWRGAFRPRVQLIWYFLPSWLLLQTIFFVRFVRPVVAVAPAVLLFAISVLAISYLFRRVSRWSFRFEDGRFHADGDRAHHDIALSSILRFSAERTTTRNETRFFAPFQLTCHLNDGRKIWVPLFVKDAGEAQFVADRANAMLASGGRDVSGGYRGEHVRVAVDDVGPSTATTKGYEEDDGEEDDATSRGRALRQNER
jgi:hypothetical protein